MKRDIIKMLAAKAKNRLMNKNLRNTYNNANIKVITDNDEDFYNKVKDMLNEEEFIENPLKRLMDDNKLMKMTPQQRERYLLETIEKYLSVRNKIFAEKNKSAVI